LIEIQYLELSLHLDVTIFSQEVDQLLHPLERRVLIRDLELGNRQTPLHRERIENIQTALPIERLPLQHLEPIQQHQELILLPIHHQHQELIHLEHTHLLHQELILLPIHHQHQELIHLEHIHLLHRGLIHPHTHHQHQELIHLEHTHLLHRDLTHLEHTHHQHPGLIHRLPQEHHQLTEQENNLNFVSFFKYSLSPFFS
jgi:hypothetical protein